MEDKYSLSGYITPNHFPRWIQILCQMYNPWSKTNTSSSSIIKSVSKPNPLAFSRTFKSTLGSLFSSMRSISKVDINIGNKRRLSNYVYKFARILKTRLFLRRCPNIESASAIFPLKAIIQYWHFIF